MIRSYDNAELPTVAVDVVEEGASSCRNRVRCEIGVHIAFDTSILESFLFAKDDAVVYDAMLVAAAIEFADKVKMRPALTWRRQFEVRIPVHDPARWSDVQVLRALQDAVCFLTGDLWSFTFCRRKRPVDFPSQHRFALPGGETAIIPFSDGLDSRAVAGLMSLELGTSLVRVRLGSKDYEDRQPGRQPFVAVPYAVHGDKGQFVESSARSRGLKVALISGLAAYLAKSKRAIVSESGQGTLGPALVTVGQGYEDYRSHPLFANRVSRFLKALCGHDVHFEFPRIWNTKGETLREFVEQCHDGASWRRTWSCWQQNRHSSVSGKRRHCGICAACMLRRVSVHAAGQVEPAETYVWEDLSTGDFALGAAAAFDKKKVTGKMREYAIAGVLHMDHLAKLPSSVTNRGALDSAAFSLSRSLVLPVNDTKQRLMRMLHQHAVEWGAFVDCLSPESFVRHWIRGGR